jgi:hypothetical protein
MKLILRNIAIVLSLMCVAIGLSYWSTRANSSDRGKSAAHSSSRQKAEPQNTPVSPTPHATDAIAKAQLSGPASTNNGTDRTASLSQQELELLHRRQRDPSRPEPKGSAPNLLEHHIPGLPDTPMGKALGEVLTAGAQVGPHAEARYQMALAKLRQNPKVAAQTLGDMYRNLEPEALDRRYDVARLAADLESHEATPLLTEIASAPIPDGTIDEHHNSPLAREGAVRYAALSGLGDLAARGNTDADATLLEIIATGHPTVKKRATLEYVQNGTDTYARRQEAAALLPENERSYAFRETTDPRKMPQVSPPETERLDRHGDESSSPKSPPNWEEAEESKSSADDPSKVEGDDGQPNGEGPAKK